jgi:ferredoxin-NADP reductase
MNDEKQLKMSGLKRFLGVFLTPSAYDFWSLKMGTTYGWRRCYARVVTRHTQSNNTFTLRLKPNNNFAGFRAGQHVNLTTLIAGRRVSRSYSISSLANSKGWVEITVRHNPAGQMSDWLFRQAHIGSVLELENVFGPMTSKSFSNKSLLFLAGGSGITPFMSLLLEQASLGMPRPVRLVYWERYDENFCFNNQLDSLAKTFSNFTLHRVTTLKNKNNRINEAQLNTLQLEIAGAQVFACGNGAFVDQARQSTAHFTADFHSEAFTPKPIEVENTTAKNFTIELLTSQRTIEASNQHSLLTTLEQQGIAVQSGCRMGICNTCSCKKVTGGTQDIHSAEIDTDNLSSVRLCISKPISNLQLAL